MKVLSSRRNGWFRWTTLVAVILIISGTLGAYEFFFSANRVVSLASPSGKYEIQVDRSRSLVVAALGEEQYLVRVIDGIGGAANWQYLLGLDWFNHDFAKMYEPEWTSDKLLYFRRQRYGRPNSEKFQSVAVSNKSGKKIRLFRLTSDDIAVAIDLESDSSIQLSLAQRSENPYMAVGAVFEDGSWVKSSQHSFLDKDSNNFAVVILANSAQISQADR